MNVYTVSFFGHRRLEWTPDMEKRFECLLSEIISQKEYVEFLLGREGDFDILAAAAIKRTVSRMNYGNVSMVLVLPYMRAEYRENESYYREYYDEIEVCHEAANAHFKAAIGIRNRCMIDRSDLVICCIQRESGGAYEAVRYARSKDVEIVDLWC